MAKGINSRPAREVPDEQEVLSYWFPPGIHSADARTYRSQWLRWFAGGPEVEREIAERFGDVLERARRGELDSWAGTPRGKTRSRSTSAGLEAKIVRRTELSDSAAKSNETVLAQSGRTRFPIRRRSCRCSTTFTT